MSQGSGDSTGLLCTAILQGQLCALLYIYQTISGISVAADLMTIQVDSNITGNGNAVFQNDVTNDLDSCTGLSSVFQSLGQVIVTSVADGSNNSVNLTSTDGVVEGYSCIIGINNCC